MYERAYLKTLDNGFIVMRARFLFTIKSFPLSDPVIRGQRIPSFNGRKFPMQNMKEFTSHLPESVMIALYIKQQVQSIKQDT